MLHTVLLSNEKLLLLRREVASPQLVFADPSKNFFSAFKAGAESWRKRSQDASGEWHNGCVHRQEVITLDNQRRDQLALFQDIFFKLLEFIISQRRNLGLELRVDFQVDHTHTPLSLLLRRLFILPEKGRNILFCGFQLEQFS